ncbi:MAG: phage portal protein [Alphaproteobacteria bacterium]|nr:phage portal protein [Alphaproteobacteria bacterium]
MFTFFDYGTDMERLKGIIKEGAESRIKDLDFLAREIANWKKSPYHKMQIDGARYYRGDHDILTRERTAIGEGGTICRVDNLPNNKILDNIYANMVDQKVNYLLGKPITFKSDDDKYTEELKNVLGKQFARLLKNIGKDCLNGAIGWIHPYYNEKGEFKFRRFEPYEILPFWKDDEHTELDAVVRVYKRLVYEGSTEKTVEYVELYDTQGVWRYVFNSGKLIKDVEHPSTYHVFAEDEAGNITPLNWDRVPMVPFKYNDDEIALIHRVKILQDAINEIESDFMNNMQEDNRNTILILKNYDGEDLGQFRHNLSLYGVVKVRSIDGCDGGVETLQVQVNSENYQSILKVLKKALIDNARGFDSDDERMNGSPNEMNLRSMYSKIDLDANGMEMEFQASFDDLLWFIDQHLANEGVGDYNDVDVDIIFDRDMIVNESEMINNCKNSVGIVSTETIIANHPFTRDPLKELEALEEEKQKNIDLYQGSFGNNNDDPNNDD